MSGKAATVQDVARRAGVSTATVSRTLTNPEKVSEATRALVTDAVRDTGYRVNRVARNLRTRRADAALVLLPDLGNAFFSEILNGIAQRLSQSGISMLVAGTPQFKDKSEDLIDYFEGGRVDRLIVLDGAFPEETLEALSASPSCTHIVFACEWCDAERWPSVRSENDAGARLAIRHLYDLGHREIGHVTGPAGNVLTHERKTAALDELKTLGIAPAEEWVIDGTFSLEAGAMAARTWLALDDRPTAMFCASDSIAFGLISELSRSGYTVPDALSVVGFDDIEMARSFVPPLTTIRQNRYQLGWDAAALLTGPPVDTPYREVLPVSLATRMSTAEKQRVSGRSSVQSPM